MIKEDAVVTTTANAGAGMTTPELPIKPVSALSKYKNMVRRKKLAKTE
jgi:hypothetical protein